MRRNDALPGQPIQEVSQRENGLRVQMRLGFFEQGKEVGVKSAVGTETKLRKGLKNEHRGEAPAAEPVLSKRQNGLFRLMEHDLSGSGEFFKTGGQWLNLNASNAGLCFGNSGEVILERTQDRAGLPDAPGEISESMLKCFTAFALFGMLLDLQIGENSSPDAGAVPQFLDKIPGCIQEVSFE